MLEAVSFAASSTGMRTQEKEFQLRKMQTKYLNESLFHCLYGLLHHSCRGAHRSKEDIEGLVGGEVLLHALRPAGTGTSGGRRERHGMKERGGRRGSGSKSWSCEGRRSRPIRHVRRSGSSRSSRGSSSSHSGCVLCLLQPSTWTATSTSTPHSIR